MNTTDRAAETAALTADALIGGRITLVQPKRGYRAGSDALLLAAAVPAGPGERVLEAGIGTGAAALALAARVAGASITGIENDAGHAELARRNFADNGLGDRIELVECDFAEATAGYLKARGIAPGFDHAMANPPFHEEGRASRPRDASRRSAHLGPRGGLDLWLARLAGAVRGGGTVTMIHRAERLDAVVAAFARHLGAITILPLAARAGEDASRVIVQARKGARAGPRLMAPLVLHARDGAPSAAAEAVLRGGAGLDLSLSPVAVRPGARSE
jgi:tRNA1(Val) A37 N6-methylase TrmN6